MISLSQNAHLKCNGGCASVVLQRPLFALQFFLPLFAQRAAFARLTHSGPRTATGAGFCAIAGLTGARASCPPLSSLALAPNRFTTHLAAAARRTEGGG